MEIEVIAKLSAIAFGSVTAGVSVVALLKGRKSQLREEYKFAKEFIADLRGVASDYEFLRQRGSHALTGDASLEFRTLEYLWQLPNPSQAIHDYSLGFKYLEHRRTTSHDDPLQFAAPYDQAWRRRGLKLLFLFLYLITYTLACSPLLLHVLDLWGVGSPLVALIITCFIFLPFAFLSLKAGVRIQRAEHLIAAQRARPNNSFKPTPLRGTTYFWR